MAVALATITTTVNPTNGVDEVVTLADSGTVSGGTLTLTFGGQTTAALDWDSTAAEIEAALEALSTIGAGNVACTGGPLPADVVVTFAGDLSGLDVGAITVDNTLITGGGTITVTVTTAGVKGSYRGAPAGCLLLTTNGVGFIYSNTGTPEKPTWTVWA